ncbi:MAG: hypothetical protein L6R38_004753 [Xanthoria sp. 2 TBL-2021]|nr:MAG: hypothetical protein L6R38_004753 [Xanthoria sp. 2 TBL-2021]
MSTDLGVPSNKLVANLTRPAIENAMVCVYPISSQYAFLPRLLFYAFTIFGVIYRHREWLVAGALASALTYSGSAVVHAVLLAGFRHEIALDLDVIPCKAVLAMSVLIVVPLLRYLQTWRLNNAKLVILLWALLITVGMVCAVVAIWTDHGAEPSCRTTNGTLLTAPNLYNSVSGFNCSYSCFASSNHLRAATEIRAMKSRRMNVPIDFRLMGLTAAVIVGLTTYGTHVGTLFSPNSSSSPSYILKWIWCALSSASFALICVTFEVGESAAYDRNDGGLDRTSQSLLIANFPTVVVIANFPHVQSWQMII